MDITYPEMGMTQGSQLPADFHTMDPPVNADDFMLRLTGSGDVPQDAAAPATSSVVATAPQTPAPSGVGGAGAPLGDYYNWMFGDTSGMPNGRSASGFSGSEPISSNVQAQIPAGVDPDAFLAALRAYDPNASIQQQQWMSGGDDPKQMQGSFVNYDVSRLPRPMDHSGAVSQIAPDRMADLQAHGIDPNLVFAPQDVASTHGIPNGLKYPDYTWMDPTYGQMTDPRNIQAPKPGFWDYMSQYAPAIISAIPSMGASLGVAGMMAPTMAQGLGMGAFNVAGRAATGQGFNPYTAAASLAAPFAGQAIGGALGIPSWIGGAATNAAGAVAGGALGNNPKPPTRTPQTTVTTDPTGYDPTRFGGGGGSTSAPQSMDTQPVQNSHSSWGTFGGGYQ